MPSRVADILMQQGAISANLWQSLGQLPGQVYAGVQAQKLRQLQEEQARLGIEGGTLDVQARQRGADATRALATIMRDTPRTAQGEWDAQTISQRMEERGFGPEASTALQHVEGMNESLRQHHEARVKVVQDGARRLRAAGNSPELAKIFLDEIERRQVFSKETLQQYRDYITADPANVAKLTDMLAGPEKVHLVSAGGVLAGEETGRIVARGAPQRPTAASLAADAAAGVPGAAEALDRFQKPAMAGVEERATAARATDVRQAARDAATAKHQQAIEKHNELVRKETERYHRQQHPETPAEAREFREWLAYMREAETTDRLQLERWKAQHQRDLPTLPGEAPPPEPPPLQPRLGFDAWKAQRGRGTRPAAAPTHPPGSHYMRSPSGATGWVPPGQVEEAKRRGWVGVAQPP